MNAGELFKAGKLQEAIDSQIQEVKRSPADMTRRLFLFELLAFAGDMERARRQIDALNYEEMELQAAAANYRKLLDSEQARQRFFRDGVAPGFLSEPPPHVGLRLEAAGRLREKKPTEAATLLQQANEAAVGLKGELNGKPFDELRDCDDLFGTVLEVMAQGNYYWVPLEQVETLALNPPRFPRDLIWLPARLDLREGATGEVFLSNLYPRSPEQASEAVKLGRCTEWVDADEGPVLGLGARLFLAGDEAVPLVEWRELKMHVAE